MQSHVAAACLLGLGLAPVGAGVPPAPVAHYDFELTLAAADGVVADAQGEVVFRPVGSGWAVAFDGRGGVSVPRLFRLADEPRLTINVWARFDAPSGERSVFALTDADSGATALAVRLHRGSLVVDLAAPPALLEWTVLSYPLPPSRPPRWWMITVVVDGDQAVLLLDGVVVARSPAPQPGKARPVDLRIAPAPFVGLLDDFRLYDRRLSPAEIRTLLAAGRAERDDEIVELAPRAINPVTLRAGYTIVRVSDGVPSVDIAQLAFKPGDDDHLYAVQTTGNVLRYDYDRVGGTLSNAVSLASGLSQSLGLGFHGDDLYVSLDRAAGDQRITRLSDADAAGVFQRRHDFVHSVPLPASGHDVNQIQIVDDTLYVGIGAAGRTGDPAEENVYTMTVARIADLTQIDFSGPLDGESRGPTNYLANPTDWVDTSAMDGQLRYHASGFRNPFGIGIDADGDLWVSSNGNSDEGYLTPDYLYKKVPSGAQGVFPPASFGFPAPHIQGNPITPHADLGQSPAVTGLDFIAGGPDDGMVVMAQFGASFQDVWPVGKDAVLVDPVTGAFEILVDDLDGPTDVVRDPFGRLLIADYFDDSIWLLTPPLPAAGAVPDGGAVAGVPLTVGKAGDELILGWGASCTAGDDDFAVYEGTLGDFDSHVPRACSTGGADSATLLLSPGDTYYLVVPRNAFHEGSYGLRSDSTPRPAAASACLPQKIGTCP